MPTEKGAILLVTLLLLCGMAILAVGSFSQRLNDLKIVTNNEQQLKVFYQAEALLTQTESLLANGIVNSDPNISVKELGRGYYRLTTKTIASYFSVKHGRRIGWSSV